MKRGPAGKGCPDVFQSQDIDQKIGDLVCLLPHGPAAGQPVGPVGEELRIMAAHGQHAGPGGADHGRRRLENPDKMAGQGPGRVPLPQIEGPLAATGLILGIIRLQAQAAEQGQRIPPMSG